MKRRDTPAERALVERARKLHRDARALVGDDVSDQDDRQWTIARLASEIGDFLSEWQDINHTYTPGERQLVCRIDAQPALG